MAKQASTDDEDLHNQAAAQRYVATADDHESEGDDEYLPLYTVGGGTTLPIKVSLRLVINDASLTMELDTGTAVTISSEKQFMNLFADTPLRKSELLLKTYSG